MPGSYLTTNSTVMCPHGGQAMLMTANSAVFADRAPILLESDIHPVVGCPFTVGPKYSPCVRIEWSAGTTRTNLNGTPGLICSSIGQCYNAEGAIQGVAIIVNTQIKADSQ